MTMTIQGHDMLRQSTANITDREIDRLPPSPRPSTPAVWMGRAQAVPPLSSAVRTLLNGSAAAAAAAAALGEGSGHLMEGVPSSSSTGGGT
jgi:hypothetical protein